MELIILIGIMSAIAAGAACYIEHGFAERHAWVPLERYGAGAFTWLVAFAAPLFAAPLPIEWAVLMYGMAWLVVGGMFAGTWAAYQKPIAMPDEDELSVKIDEARGR